MDKTIVGVLVFACLFLPECIASESDESAKAAKEIAQGYGCDGRLIEVDGTIWTIRINSGAELSFDSSDIKVLQIRNEPRQQWRTVCITLSTGKEIYFTDSDTENVAKLKAEFKKSKQR